MKIHLVGVSPKPILKKKIEQLGWQLLKTVQVPVTAPPDEIFIVSGKTQIGQTEACVVRLIEEVSKENPFPAAVDDFWIELDWQTHFPLNLYRTLELRKEKQANSYHLEAMTQFTESLVEQIEKNVELAKSLQKILIPENTPIFPGVHLLSRFIPSQGFGGDYFDFFILEKDRELGIFAASSTTHHLTAKLLGELLKLKVEELRVAFPKPMDLIDHLKAAFETKELRQISLFYGIFTRKDLVFKCATHGEFLISFVRKQALPKTAAKVQLLPGDRLILSTSSLYELSKSEPSEWEKLVKTEGTLSDLQREILTFEHSKHGEARKKDVVLILLELDSRLLFVPS